MIQSITYAITTNRNIKCYGCTDNCEKFLSEKYVEPETFRNHMSIIKNITSLSEIHFSVGESLLHKGLEEICQIAHSYFPQAIIYIHTNGILMNTLKDNQLLNLTKNNNVKFLFYLYPIASYLKSYQKQIDRFARLNIDMFWTHEHIYFNKFTLNRYNTTCENLLRNKFQLIIIDGKLYPQCSFIQNIQFYIPNNNYIDLKDLKNIKQIQNLFNSINCSECKKNSIPLSNIYVNDYKRYEILIDYVYDLGYFLQIPFFYKNIQDSTSLKEFEAILNKHLNGWMDIYIPFYKIEYNKILELKKYLTEQKNINKFNLYFISIDDDIVTQQQWFEIFGLPDNKLNTYFLKGKSLYLGEKKFFDHSRIINHYILDINDIELLKDNSYLSNIADKRRTK